MNLYYTYLYFFSFYSFCRDKCKKRATRCRWTWTDPSRMLSTGTRCPSSKPKWRAKEMASRLSFQTWLTSLELWAGHQLVSEIFPNVSRNMLKTQFTPTLQIAANTSVASWVPKPSSTSKTSVTLSTELTMQLNCKTCWTDSSKSELNYRAFTSKTF